ncbi:helix-turn-helix domain-containing protein [Atopobacter sp. AH10]|uniref:helix-turn-helix domain-containing protein n=1 Tax=Atopobacter sp. AH10 TaxID=2315861 RepID=UPI000EF17F72|nr:helix-turn-helix domain-containing protein [Atopobacter sp. AH10]RLK63237.1 helix-turn-helix domain-containing protein [Atopobacter sp. AH10]
MKQLGDVLREARLQKGFSYDDLEKITKIQKHYLEAIDRNQLDQLPSQFYARAFIKQYAKAVNVDGDWLLNAFESKMSDLADETSEEEIIPLPSRSRKEGVYQSTLKLVQQTIQNFLPLFILLFFVLMLILLLMSAFNETEQKKKAEYQTEQKIKDETSIQEEKPSLKTAKVKKRGESDYMVESQDGPNLFLSSKDVDLPAKLTLKASEDGQSWIGVNVDGQLLYQGLIGYGQSVDLTIPKGTTSFSVNMGYAPVVNISINGLPFSPPDDFKEMTTQYIEWTLSKKGR